MDATSLPAGEMVRLAPVPKRMENPQARTPACNCLWAKRQNRPFRRHRWCAPRSRRRDSCPASRQCPSAVRRQRQTAREGSRLPQPRLDRDLKAIRFEMVSLVITLDIAPPKIFEHPILRRATIVSSSNGVRELRRGTGVALRLCFAAMRPSCYAAGSKRKAIRGRKTIYVRSQ